MNLHRALTFRYIIALSLIAIVITSAYFILHQQLKVNKKDAYLINVSGMQRMLSQRIALFAHEINHSKNEAKASIYEQKMAKAVDRMLSNHKELTTGQLLEKPPYELSDKLKELYFSDGGIDEQVTVYLSLAEKYLLLFETQGLEAVHEANFVEEITKIARNGLLGDLNSVVEQYQREAESRINNFRKIELFILLFGLSVLVLEVFLIFRPMVNQVVQKTEGLEKSNAELREFSYRISHDLRAPIISSIGLVDVTKQFLDQGNTEPAQEALEHIDVSMHRMESLVEDIINLTKMKQIDIDKEHVNLVSLTTKIIEKIGHMPNFEKIKIHKDIALEDTISVKKMYLEQTMENLISNSVKYFDPDKPKSYIEIKARKENSLIKINIRDNGIGIPEDYREQMFEMFKRFHPKVSFGSGLGLYLVSQNVKQLDGKISYIPHEDGSEFVIEIPV